MQPCSINWRVACFCLQCRLADTGGRQHSWPFAWDLGQPFEREGYDGRSIFILWRHGLGMPNVWTQQSNAGATFDGEPADRSGCYFLAASQMALFNGWRIWAWKEPELVPRNKLRNTYCSWFVFFKHGHFIFKIAKKSIKFQVSQRSPKKTPIFMSCHVPPLLLSRFPSSACSAGYVGKKIQWWLGRKGEYHTHKHRKLQEKS